MPKRRRLEQHYDTHLPHQVVVAVVVLCVLPAVLTLMGFDFGTRAAPLGAAGVGHLHGHQLEDRLHRALAGSFTHTILEWSAFCTAVFTGVFAFVHYAIKRDTTTPIIGMALLSACAIDAFHTLAANRLIQAAADNRDLIPFTWALCRVFHALVMIVCIGLLLMRRKRSETQAGFISVVLVGLVFGLVAWALIQYCALGTWLPRTQFPGALVTRPYDVIPLAMFLFAGVFVFRPFHRWQNTLFSHALVVSIIPQIATHLHVVLGSSRLHDSHFNIAHFLKVIAYAVPLVGLVLDYVRTYLRQRDHAEELAEYNVQLVAARNGLQLQAQQLASSNRELEEFARVASHDLQEPLRKVQAFGDRLRDRYAENLPDAGRDYVDRMLNATARMQTLINDLLTFSRVTTRGRPFERVDLAKVAGQVLSDLEVRVEETSGVVHLNNLPTIDADSTQMRQLFQNLISNALKYHRAGTPPVVNVTARITEGGRICRIEFVDNGIGFESKHAQRIFAVFQRLHGRGEYEGTGVGLAVCRKIAERHRGTIEAHGEPGEGATFVVTLPATQENKENTACAA